MAEVTLKLQDPAMIDGEPAEVAKQAVEQLARALEALAPVAQATYNQVRNAGLSAALAAGTDASEPGALDEWWRKNGNGQRGHARMAAERVDDARRHAAALREKL